MTRKSDLFDRLEELGFEGDRNRRYTIGLLTQIRDHLEARVVLDADQQGINLEKVIRWDICEDIHDCSEQLESMGFVCFDDPHYTYKMLYEVRRVVRTMFLELLDQETPEEREARKEQEAIIEARRRQEEEIIEARRQR